MESEEFYQVVKMGIDGLLNNRALEDEESLARLVGVLLEDNSREGRLVQRNLSIYKTLH